PHYLLLEKDIAAREKIVSHPIEPRVKSAHLRKHGFGNCHIGAGQPLAPDIHDVLLGVAPVDDGERTCNLVGKPSGPDPFPDRIDATAHRADAGGRSFERLLNPLQPTWLGYGVVIEKNDVAARGFLPAAVARVAQADLVLANIADR